MRLAMCCFNLRALQQVTGPEKVLGWGEGVLQLGGGGIGAGGAGGCHERDMCVRYKALLVVRSLAYEIKQGY